MGIEFVFKSMAALIVIIIAANYLIKQLNQLAMKSARNIKVIERLPLSKTSSLYIIEVVGRYYLMSGTEQNNEILKELDGAELERYIETAEEQENKPEWLIVLTEKLEKRKQS